MARDRSMHLAGYLPFFTNAALWRNESHADPLDFTGYAEYVRRLEDAKFDFIFLAEGLRIREYNGEVVDVFLAGRPDNLTMMAALSAITTRIGLAITTTATFNEPYELARELATLDSFGRGRAAWNVVTSSDSFHAAQFRRGPFLPHPERYNRAAEFIDACQAMWSSRANGGDGRFSHHGRHIDVEGVFNALPPAEAESPVLIQAGDSPQGRDLAAKYISAIFSPHDGDEESLAFAADMTRRLEANGRTRNDLKILPHGSVVVADTEAEAVEKDWEQRRQNVTGRVALFNASQVWGVDLTDRDPNDPLPDFGPDPDGPLEFFHTFSVRNRFDLVDKWRKVSADGGGLSLLETAIAISPSAAFIGTPKSVAAEMTRRFEIGACDGYIMEPRLIPSGMDEFIDLVIPELRDLGSFREEYDGDTLRDHLELTRQPSVV